MKKTTAKDLQRVRVEGIDIENVYTDENWENDGSLHLEEGWAISPEVFHQLLNSVPPMTYSRGTFQPGEAADYDFERHCQLYQTFEQVAGHYYKYMGLQPARG